MDDILVKSRFISQLTIDQCIARFQQIKSLPKPVLTVRAELDLEDVDILLIAYFLLFKSECARIEIHIVLQKSQPYVLVDKLKRYMVYTVLNIGTEVFDIRYSEGLRIDNTRNSLSIHNVYLSGKYLPILFVSEESYKSLFEESIPALQRPVSGIPYEINNDLLFSAYESYAKFRIIRIKEHHNSMQEFARYAFYKILADAKVISIYYDEDYRRSGIRRPGQTLSSLRGDDAYELFNSVKYVFEELADKPAIFQFIYSSFLASGILPGTINSKTKKSYQDAAINLWELTKKIVKGIIELAKNAYQHTESGVGIITGRVYQSQIWEELKKDHEEAGDLLENYIQKVKKQLKDKELAFFDLNIIDAGSVGVTQKLIENTDKEGMPELLERELAEDCQRIRDREVRFEHFLNPETLLLLNQQAKRASAHLGLLTFAKLVSENSGFLRASTWLTAEKDLLREPILVPTSLGNADEVPLSPMGTNFHMVIPFRPYKPQTVSEATTNVRTPSNSASSVQGMEVMLKYTMVEVKPKLLVVLPDLKENLILSLETEIKMIYNRQDESKFWDLLVNGKNKQYLQQILPGTSNMVAINLDASNINASQLFRFLGKWELQYPGKVILLYNLSAEIYHDLIEINEFFTERFIDFDYWNGTSVVGFYTYNKYGPENRRFYFTDLLWGKKKHDYLFINKMVRRTSFNATCIFQKNLEDVSAIGNDDFAYLARLPLFHSGLTLLPLDLLLKGHAGLTLFEHNAMVLLQKELV